MERITVIILFFGLFVAKCEATCQETYCEEFCNFGYALAGDGCSSCQCLPQARSGNTPTCETISCYAACPNGYQQEGQCPTCKCAPADAVRAFVGSTLQADGCSDVFCYRGCPTGYETDSSGCPTCTCVPSDEGVKNPLDSDQKKLVPGKSFVKSIVDAICSLGSFPGCS